MTGAAATLLISRRDVRALMSLEDYLQAVESGFRAVAEGKAHAPAPMTVEGVAGAFHAKGASLTLERPFVALKFNGNFPDNPLRRGLPTIQGAILLCDGETGSLLAVIDSIEITIRRTAAATALAARYLARAQSESVFICGCGEQGEAQLAALEEVLPLRRCFLFDREPAKAQALASRIGAAGRLKAEVAADLAPARESDVVVTCTTARQPYLESRHIGAGTFVAAVGADSPDKNEVHPELMGKAKVVADVLAQCVDMGDLRHALAAGTMGVENVHAELADLVSGRKAGRSDEEEISLFDSTGTALQDVATAALLYDRASRASGFPTITLGSA